MKDSKMRKARSLKRAAGILALVMVLPLASCNRKTSKKSSDRKYASGKEIQETDPFFNAEINELKLPLKEGKKIIDTIEILSSELDENGITSVEDVELKFHILDEETYDTIADSDVISFSAK